MLSNLRCHLSDELFVSLIMQSIPSFSTVSIKDIKATGDNTGDGTPCIFNTLVSAYPTQILKTTGDSCEPNYNYRTIPECS